MEQDDGSKGNGRVKVAILGGGPGGLTAAYYLTTLEPEKYDITVYEMSWRLGGKTASGRDENGRIEEHGLHVLFGGYHNAFDMMLGCYDALAKIEQADNLVFRDFLDAVLPADLGVIGDERFKKFRQWDLQFPVNRGVPGDPPLPTTWDLVTMFSQVLVQATLGASVLRVIQRRVGMLGDSRVFSRRGRARARDTVGDGGDWFVRRVLIPISLRAVDKESLMGSACLSGARAVRWLVRRLEFLVRPEFLRAGPPGRLWTAADLASATFIGLSEDRVLSAPDGYQGIDSLDLREWLEKHGASKHARHSPLVRIIYDAAFSYPNGGAQPEPLAGSKQRSSLKQSVSAGAALRIMLWMALTYKGAIYFKMKAGMGEIIHVPLYRLLKYRGVKFEFLHRVTGLHPGKDEDGQPVIDEIEIEQIAATRGAAYDPLVRVKDLDCWPAKPIEEQIDPVDYYDAIHAEQFFHRPRHPRIVRLERRGRISARDSQEGAPAADRFDKVIFAIPVACIPFVCTSLVRADRGLWSRQDRIGTTQTVAAQLWCKYSLRELGWDNAPPLLSLFWDPLNTWCDATQVLARENWPAERHPVMLAYFCGPLPHEWPGPEASRVSPTVDKEWRERLARQATGAADTLFAHLPELWPGFGTPLEDGAEQVQHWNVLFDPLNRAGAARREAQYLRANFDPHERCTLALPGEGENRISADETGYANLTVAGDWIANDILVACFEGTVQGGLRAARAVSERKDLYRIIGEDLLNPGRDMPRRPPRGLPREPPVSPRRDARTPPEKSEERAPAVAAERTRGSPAVFGDGEEPPLGA